MSAQTRQNLCPLESLVSEGLAYANTRPIENCRLEIDCKKCIGKICVELLEGQCDQIDPPKQCIGRSQTNET